jgi:hypothetical protein
MVQAPSRPRKRRLTQAQALQQVREQIKEAESQPKSKRIDSQDSTETRDRERWITLPKHLAQYVGEQAVISSGWIWTHRLDRLHSWTDSQGNKHTPVRLVCLVPADALDPNYKPEKKGLSQPTAEGDKTPDFVLGSDASCSSEHLSENEGVLSPSGGRPKKNGHDELILQLAGEGKGAKAIARALHRDGIEMSYRTVARRLAEMRG